MNLAELQRKLIAAARAHAPGDRVPYAFEKRVTALLASRVAPPMLDFWVRGLWRAALSCVAIAVLCGLWSLSAPAVKPATAASSADLSQDFETLLLASVDQSEPMP